MSHRGFTEITERRKSSVPILARLSSPSIPTEERTEELDRKLTALPVLFRACTSTR